MRERIVCKRFKKSAFDVGKWNALVRQRIVQESIIQSPDGNPALYCQSCCRAGGLPHGNTKLDRGQTEQQVCPTESYLNSSGANSRRQRRQVKNS